MKTKLLFLVCLSFLVVSTAMAQPKPKLKPPSNEGVKSSKEITKLLEALYLEAKLVGKTNPDCDPVQYLTYTPRYLPGQTYIINVLPRKWALGRIVDKFLRKNFHIHNSFANSKTLKEFTELYYARTLDKISESEKKRAKKFYDDLTSLSTEGLQIHKKKKRYWSCVIATDTKMILTSIKSYSKNIHTKKPSTNFYWDVKTTFDIKCDCTKENKKNLKNAKLEYTGKLRSELMYDPEKRFITTKAVKPNFQYKVIEAVCCPKEESESEDGSFMDPNENEDIVFPNQFIEVGAGIGTAKDEETELCASVGFMHNLLPGEDNALFVGGRASVHNASFSSADFSQTSINVGPAAEFQTFIGDTSTKWINGVNGVFVFGSQNSGAFKTDISGINIGLYTGVEVPLGDQFALGVMANLISFNNLTFKTDEGEFKSNSTGINLNKGSVGLNLRINLDSKN